MNLNLGSRLSCFQSDVRSTVDSVTAPIIISIKTHYKKKPSNRMYCAFQKFHYTFQNSHFTFQNLSRHFNFSLYTIQNSYNIIHNSDHIFHNSRDQF